MDMSYCPPLQLQDNSFFFDCQSLLEKSYDSAAYDPASDPGYFSAGSSLSPTSSVDSFCFSPTSVQAVTNDQDALEHFIFSSHEVSGLSNQTQTLPCSRASCSATTSTTKRSRSKYPGKKRQTASEREKLRMRDLTKALHHLRAYLPPSVAPAGQTLTKIETLRLTIRYISHLSDQLGLSEEALETRRPSRVMDTPQTLSQFMGQTTADYRPPQQSGCDSLSLAPLPSPQNTYQVCSDVTFDLLSFLTNEYSMK